LPQIAVNVNRTSLFPNAGVLRVRDPTGDFIDIIARGNTVDPDSHFSANPGQSAAALRDTPWPNFLLFP